MNESGKRLENPVELLAAPVLNRDFDFIAPYYLRHKFDGTITNGIIYPITRALFARRVRQPIGGEFGNSKKARMLPFPASRKMCM